MKVLAVGAHPDDVEIGCGGALLQHRLAGDDVALLVMTDGGRESTGAAVRRDEQSDAASLLEAALYWGGFEDGAVPAGKEAVDAVQAALRASGADLVYTHAPQDTHQDHRATAAATVAATRRVSRVLFFESPTTVGFAPNFYVDVAGLVEPKLDLVRCHISQVMKNGLVDLDALEAQARFRGFSARSRHAEAFEVHRFLWAPGAAAPGQPDEAAVSAELAGELEASGAPGAG